MCLLVAPLQATAESFKELILSNEYWQGVDAAVAVCEPIVKLLRLADGDTPATGKVHYYSSKVRQSNMLLCVLTGIAMFCNTSPVFEAYGLQ
jgi:hypothetical protein